jgi:hypothetical protein
VSAKPSMRYRKGRREGEVVVVARGPELSDITWRPCFRPLSEAEHVSNVREPSLLSTMKQSFRNTRFQFHPRVWQY